MRRVKEKCLFLLDHYMFLLDHYILVERFGRSLKYEWLYLNDYESVRDFSRGLQKYLRFYNTERLHSSLGYRTPEEVYFENRSPMAV